MYTVDVAYKDYVKDLRFQAFDANGVCTHDYVESAPSPLRAMTKEAFKDYGPLETGEYIFVLHLGGRLEISLPDAL